MQLRHPAGVLLCSLRSENRSRANGRGGRSRISDGRAAAAEGDNIWLSFCRKASGHGRICTHEWRIICVFFFHIHAMDPFGPVVIPFSFPSPSGRVTRPSPMPWPRSGSRNSLLPGIDFLKISVRLPRLPRLQGTPVKVNYRTPSNLKKNN